MALTGAEKEVPLPGLQALRAQSAFSTCAHSATCANGRSV